MVIRADNERLSLHAKLSDAEQEIASLRAENEKFRLGMGRQVFVSENERLRAELAEKDLEAVTYLRRLADIFPGSRYADIVKAIDKDAAREAGEG